MVKMTFSVDDETAHRLRSTAQRLGKPQSEVVREAVAEYAERVERLSEAERRSMLRQFDELVPALPRRSLRAVEAEIRAVRAARRGGGRAG